jgi:hypothetical protein
MRRTPLSGRGIGDVMEDISEQQRQMEMRNCLDQANTLVASLDATTNDLAKNWHPTGLYAPADIQALIVKTMALVSSATDRVGAAPRSTSDAEGQINQALTTLFQKGEASMVYVQALRDASTSGATVIQADGLKRWVIETMGAVSNALVTASVMECNMPWLATLIITFQGHFDALSEVAMAIYGVVKEVAIKAGETIMKVADTVPDLITWAKWGAIAYGVIWLYGEFTKRRSGE